MLSKSMLERYKDMKDLSKLLRVWTDARKRIAFANLAIRLVKYLASIRREVQL